jgi:hypothetical protein
MENPDSLLDASISVLSAKGANFASRIIQAKGHTGITTDEIDESDQSWPFSFYPFHRWFLSTSSQIRMDKLPAELFLYNH